MSDNQVTGEVTSDLEKSFNETLEEFRKAYGVVEEEAETEDELEKASGKSKSKMDYDDDADDAEESEEEEDEENEDVKKSVEDFLAEDVEAEAAMDVEPFLRQLAKAIDQRIDGLQKSFSTSQAGVETLLKSQGKAMYIQMELQKSMSDTTQKIAKEDRAVGGLHRFQKARFESEGNEPIDYTGADVLNKSLGWLQEGKIDMVESGLLERRVNQNRLFKAMDDLDNKIAKLLKEAS